MLYTPYYSCNKQDYSTVVQKWHDQYLAWDPAEYNGIVKMQLPSTTFWKPDVVLYNSVDESFDTMYKPNLVLKYDGSIEWLPPGIVKSTCLIDITWFPFDQQTCHLKYGAWTHHGHLINMSVGEISIGTYTTNGEWDLLEVTGTRNSADFEGYPYLDITFSIRIKRRTLYYGLNLIIPCLLISLMTLLDFILPPDSGEKLTLGLTVFMSLCFFLLMIAEALPPTSDAVPLIAVYFSSTMLVVSISQIFTVLVLNFQHRKPVTHEMSPWMATLFLHWLPWVLLMHRPGYAARKYELIRLETLHINPKHKDQACSPIVVPKVTYRALSDSIRMHSDILAQQKLLDSCSPAIFQRMEMLERQLGAILNELKYLTKKLREEDEEKKVIEDWKFAAMVLDRFCLWLFTIFMIGLTCGLIFSAPNL